MRKAQPYECYSELDFDIPVSENGDGIIVSVDLLRPSRRLCGLRGRGRASFDSFDQTQAVIGAVMNRYNVIIAAIDAGFKKLEAKEPIDYRPLFFTSSDKPKHDVVGIWIHGPKP